MKLCKVVGDFVFERAYCYYRLHDNEKALELVMDRTDERCLELKEIYANFFLYRILFALMFIKNTYRCLFAFFATESK